MSVLVVWLAGFLLLWSPGLILGRLARLRSHPDWLVLLAIQLGLGMAFWPVLLLWTTALGWRWSPGGAQVFAIVACIGGLAALLIVPRATWHARMKRMQQQGQWLLMFGCVMALAAVLRFLHLRGLALPPWVDPVHHTMIVRLIFEQGKVPVALDPIIAGGVLTYHWGFHALVAWVAWLLRAQDAFALADMVLAVGQLFNVLVVLMLYSGARVLFASRRAGLLSAALVGTVSWLPAYYVAWGRFTHLAGVVLLIPLLVQLWRLRNRPALGAWLAAVLLAAGLALVHVRVAYMGAMLLVWVAGWECLHRRWRAPLTWVGVALAAGLVTLPWWLTLLQSTWVRDLLSASGEGAAAWAGFNQVDWGLVWMPRNDWLIGLSTLGVSLLAGWHDPMTDARWMGAVWLLILGASTAWVLVRHFCIGVTRRVWGGWLLLVLWVGLAAVLTQPERWGLPQIRIAQINAAIITLFVPLCLASGGFLAWVLGVWTPPRWAAAVTAVAALGLSIVGATGMQSVVTGTTVLATAADRAALVWVGEHTPADARFAVAAFPWLEDVYAGSDGGYWIPLLANRTSILPPALYVNSLSATEVKQTNEFLAMWSVATSLDDRTLRERLRKDGVTHVYVGARSGLLRAEALEGQPFVKLVYAENGVSIFELLPEQSQMR